MLFLNDISPISLHGDSPENQEKYNYVKLIEYEKNQAIVAKWPYLRRSFQTNRKVDEVIISNIDDTIWLAAVSIFLASVFGISLGIIAAVKEGTMIDKLATFGTVIGISIPSYVAAVLIAYTFGYYLSDFTGLNITGQLWETHPIRGKELHIQNMILPAITLSIIPLSIIAQLTRNSMIDVLKQDYIRTAWAKGL